MRAARRRLNLALACLALLSARASLTRPARRSPGSPLAFGLDAVLVESDTGRCWSAGGYGDVRNQGGALTTGTVRR